MGKSYRETFHLHPLIVRRATHLNESGFLYL